MLSRPFRIWNEEKPELDNYQAERGAGSVLICAAADVQALAAASLSNRGERWLCIGYRHTIDWSFSWVINHNGVQPH